MQGRSRSTYQFQNRHFHHALIEVSWFVFDHFYRYDLVGLQVLTFDHLTECSLSQDVENQISRYGNRLNQQCNTRTTFVARQGRGDVLVTLIGTQPIVDIEDVIIILIVIAFVVRRFARFSQHPPRIMRGLVSELGIADVVRFQDVGRE
jgi:hypothetical protein